MEFIIYFDEMTDKDGKNLLKLINDECSYTLKKLVLQDCKWKLLDELSNKFPDLNILALIGGKTDSNQFPNKTIELSNIFPNVEKLTLAHLNEPEWKYTGKLKFSLLTELQIVLAKSQNVQHFDESDMINFLELNTYIDRLTIQYMNLRLLQKLSKCSSKLVKLELRFFADNFLNINLMEGDLIRFDVVQELTIRSDQVSDKMHENIVFDQLKELELSLRDEFNENWIKFIDKQVNKQLKDITISAKKLNGEHFLAIADKLPNIKSACFHASSIYVVNDFLQFFERIENLQMLHVVGEMNESEYKLLYQKLPDSNWSVSVDFITFENMANITIRR